MTNQEILTKAIEKALKNGLDLKSCYENSVIKEKFIGSNVYDDNQWIISCLTNKYFEDMYMKLIFSHEFAKAFWGEELVVPSYPKSLNDDYVEDAITVDDMIKLWQYHLQQMVLKEEPIKYLEKFI